MKKLLLLLLLIPTLIQAEEFKLLCEGERVLTKSNSDVFRIKKSIAVKVRKASIRAEDETYYNGNSARFKGSYKKDKDLITNLKEMEVVKQIYRMKDNDSELQTSFRTIARVVRMNVSKVHRIYNDEIYEQFL